MKAAVSRKYGPPDVISVTEIEKPTPKHDEVLVKVHAATVNRTDCGFLRAQPWIVRLFSGLVRPNAIVLGNEFAGEVESVGGGVTSFKVGDRVFGYDGVHFGSHAEYKVVAKDGLIATIPAGMSYEQAAPITEGAHYALNYIQAARIRSGQRILINGATGAIGSAAVQLIKHLGAHVTAVCDTGNLERVKSLGADHVIDYTQEDFTEIGETFDAVLDAVGKSSFGKCKRLLRPDGIYMSSELGDWVQNPFLAMVTPLFGGRKVLFPIPKDKQEDVLFLKQLVEAGEFMPVIDRSYPLEQIAEAYRYVEKGHKVGNVVISIAQ